MGTYRAKHILQDLADQLFVIDKEGIIQHIFDLGEGESSLPSEKLLNRHIQEVLPDGLNEDLSLLLPTVLDSGRREQLSYKLELAEDTQYYTCCIKRHSDRELAVSIRNVSKEQQLKVELEEKNDFIQSILFTSPNYICVRDADGIIIMHNLAFAELLTGDASEDLRGFNLNDYYTEGDEKAYFRATDRMTLEGKEVVRTQESLTRRNGELVFLETSKKLLVTAEGHTHILATSVDVTEHVNDKQALEHREKLYRLLSENSRDIISLHNLSGQYFYVSQAVEKMLGYAPEELLGTNAWDLIHPEDYPRVREDFELGSKEKKPYMTFQYRARKKDGSYAWLESTIKHVIGWQAGEIKLQVTSRDLSERRRDQARLERSRKKFRDLVKYSQAYIFTHDMEGRLLSINPYFRKMMGYAEKDVVGKYISDFFPDMSDQSMESYLGRFQEQKHLEGEVRIKGKAGEVRHMLYQNFLIEEPDTEAYVICNAQDITERAQALEELKKAKELAEESLAMQENFLANMSHEIRTPMHGILGLSTLLAKTELSESQAGYLDIIRKSAENLLIIINDILDFSKIEEGKLELEEIPFDLQEVMHTAYQTLALKAEEKGLIFTIDDTGLNSTLLQGDPYRLNQVLLNLMGNAIKFTQEGRVELRVKTLQENSEGVRLQFAVQDTGTGIAREQLDRVFESFTQAYAGVTRKFGGTGLGLSICKKLIELQGGRIWVESSEGVGSTFSFELEFGKCSEMPEEFRKPEAIDFASLKDVRVLVAEDNEINVMLAKTLLNRWHMQVDVALNGKEAVELAKANSYDIILMDIRMPELNGLDATRQIRELADKKKANTPILAVTANVIKRDAERYLKKGMDGYLSKPFNEKELYLKLKKHLPHKLKSKDIQAEAAIQPLSPAPADVSSDMPAGLDAELQVCDLSYLHELSAGDKEYMMEMLEIFRRNVPRDLSRLQEAISAKDFPAMQDVAHKLKSTVAILGVQSMREELSRIEKLSKKPENLKEIEQKHTHLSALKEQALLEVEQLITEFVS